MFHFVTDPYLGEMISAAVELAVRVEGSAASLWLRLPPATFPSGDSGRPSWRLRLADEVRAWDFGMADGTLRDLAWASHEIRVSIELPREWRGDGDEHPALRLGAVRDVVLIRESDG